VSEGGRDLLLEELDRPVSIAIAVNRRKLALKSAFLTWALVCLIVAVLLLGGYFIYAQFWNRVRL